VTEPVPALVTLHLWRVGATGVPRALLRMGRDRARVRRTPGLRFAKLLGTGDGRTFTVRDADPHRWGLLATWTSPEAAQAFERRSPVARAWRELAVEHWRADLLEHRGTGRLLRRSPDGTLDVLHDGLHFANGVALAADESFVVVAQTGAYQLDRVWLTGDRAPETFAGGLPGFPDNIATGSDGLIWIAMASPRVPALDILSRLHPVLRKAAWTLPQQLQPREKKVVWVRALDESGKIVHDFCGTHPRFHLVTGVREAGGTVYLGSLQERAIAYFDLP